MDKNIQLDAQTKKIIELVQQLRKIDSDEFKDHLEQVRNSSDIQIIPYLVELLAEEKIEEEKKKAILELVMDIKHPEAAKLLTQGVKYLRGTAELQPYLAALWQNSLSFADDLELYVEFVLTTDYLTAYDAFTIIENSAGDASPKAIASAIGTLTKGLDTQDESKKPMVMELIKVLKEFESL